MLEVALFAVAQVACVFLLVRYALDRDARDCQEREQLTAAVRAEGQRRDTETERWRLMLAAERAAHRDMVADLLQRIQAPEVAVAEHATAGPVVMPQSVPTEDDGAFWDAKAETDAEVAEALERIRAMEAEQKQLQEYEARVA